MSYICEFCGLRPESCACSVDLTEPRLESELAVADNIMAVENQKPYGLLNAPSPSDFFSLLTELESQEEDFELGPPPKFMRQTNMPPGINFPDEEPLMFDEPIQTPPIKSILEGVPIPKLERQTNMPPGMNFSDEDLKEIAVELFPEEDAYIEYLKQPQSLEYLKLSEKLDNTGSYQEFCFVMNEMKNLYDLETSVIKEDVPKDELPPIEYCETCCDFSCECDKMVHCDCGAFYYIDEPYQMCFDCEMAYRRQESIDQELYPDDIRERYDSH
jgi:hypothetical protein